MADYKDADNNPISGRTPDQIAASLIGKKGVDFNSGIFRRVSPSIIKEGLKQQGIKAETMDNGEQYPVATEAPIIPVKQPAPSAIATPVEKPLTDSQSQGQSQAATANAYGSRITDGFNSIFAPAPESVTEAKQAKLAGAKQHKQNKLAPNRVPNTLAEFAKDKPNINLSDITAYENAFAAQTVNDAKIEKERSGNFIIEDTDSIMGNFANLGIQGAVGLAKYATDVGAAIPEWASAQQRKTITQGERNLLKAAEAKKAKGQPLTAAEQSVYEPQKLTQEVRQRTGEYGDQFQGTGAESTDGVTSAYGAKPKQASYEKTAKPNKTEQVNIPTNISAADKIKSEADIKKYITEPTNKFQKFLRTHVNTNNEDKFIAALGDTYDKSKVMFKEGNYAAGVNELVSGGIVDNIENLSAATGYLLESLPYMIPSLRTSANIAYAVDTMTKGIEKFAEDANREPTNAEIDEIMRWSASAALTEFAAGKLAFPGRKAALDAGAAAAKVESAATNLTRKVTKGLVVEGGTEGYQTTAEQMAGTLDASKLEGKEIYTASAIGGGIGGGIAIGTTDTSKAIAKAAGKAALGTAVVAGLGTMAATKLAKDLTIKGAAKAREQANKPATGTDETVDNELEKQAYAEASKERRGKILSAAGKIATSVIPTTIDAVADLPTTIKKAGSIASAGLKNISALKGKLGNAYKDSVARAKFTDAKATSEAVKTGDIEVAKATGKPEVVVETLLDPAFVPATEVERQAHVGEVKAEISKLFTKAMEAVDGSEEQTALITKAELYQERLKGLSKLSVPTPNEMSVLVDTVNDEDKPTPETDEAIKRVFGSMDTSPGSVSVENAQSIIDSGVATTEQVAKLDSYIKLENSKNSLEVNSDVLKGSDGFLGIESYQNMISGARKTGDAIGETKAIDGLKKFADVHVKKVDAITEAFHAVVANAPNANVLVANVKKTYGVNVHKNSNLGDKQFITNLGLEAVALKSAVAHETGKAYVAPVASATVTSTTDSTAPEVAPKSEASKPATAPVPENITTADQGISRIKEYTDALENAEFKTELGDVLKNNIAKLHSKTPIKNVQKVLDMVQKLAAYSKVEPLVKTDTTTGTETESLYPYANNSPTDMTDAELTAAISWDALPDDVDYDDARFQAIEDKMNEFIAESDKRGITDYAGAEKVKSAKVVSNLATEYNKIRDREAYRTDNFTRATDAGDKAEIAEAAKLLKVETDTLAEFEGNNTGLFSDIQAVAKKKRIARRDANTGSSTFGNKSATDKLNADIVNNIANMSDTELEKGIASRKLKLSNELKLPLEQQNLSGRAQFNIGQEQLAMTSELERRAKANPTLKGSGRASVKLLAKDQAKSDQATKFIGFGKEGTSTKQYAEAWGENANTGKYTNEDTVFVSVNGGKGQDFKNMLDTLIEVDKAVQAGATIIADKAGTGTGQRNSTHNNSGEGKLATHLDERGYVEVEAGSGVWTKAEPASKSKPKGVHTVLLGQGNGTTSEVLAGNDVKLAEKHIEGFITRQMKATNVVTDGDGNTVSPVGRVRMAMSNKGLSVNLNRTNALNDFIEARLAGTTEQSFADWRIGKSDATTTRDPLLTSTLATTIPVESMTELEGEVSDVIVMAASLGIPMSQSTDKAPTVSDVIEAQSKILPILVKVLDTGVITDAQKATIGKALSIVSGKVGSHGQKRIERAEKSFRKYGEGNYAGHMLSQVTEELGEIAEEIIREDTVTDNTAASKLIEAQKRVFKVIRFSPTTVNKDSGKTNATQMAETVSGLVEVPSNLDTLSSYAKLATTLSSSISSSLTTPSTRVEGRNYADSIAEPLPVPAKIIQYARSSVMSKWWNAKQFAKYSKEFLAKDAWTFVPEKTIGAGKDKVTLAATQFRTPKWDMQLSADFFTAAQIFWKRVYDDKLTISTSPEVKEQFRLFKDATETLEQINTFNSNMYESHSRAEQLFGDDTNSLSWRDDVSSIARQDQAKLDEIYAAIHTINPDVTKPALDVMFYNNKNVPVTYAQLLEKASPELDAKGNSVVTTQNDAIVSQEDIDTDVQEDYIDTSNYNPEESTESTGGEVNVEVTPTNTLRSRQLGLRPLINNAAEVISKGIQGKLKDNFVSKQNLNSKLHTVANFFTEYKADARVAGKLSTFQSAGLNALSSFNDSMSAGINTLFKRIDAVGVSGKTGKEYDALELRKDMFQYLISEDGSINENLLATMSIVSANWLGTEAYNNVYNDRAAINKILGKPADTPLVHGASEILGKVGTVDNVIKESLGREILAATGIKAKQGVDGNIEGNLALSMGQMAVAAMLDGGLLTEQTVNSNAIANLAGDNNVGDAGKAYTSFLRVAVQTNAKGVDKPAQIIDDLVKVLRDSENVTESLFGVVSKETGPVFEEPTKVVKGIKGNFQKVAQAVRNVISKHQKRPLSAKTDVMGVWDYLPEEYQKDLLGYIEDMEATTHAYHHAGVIGLNNEIERSLDNNINFRDKLLNQADGIKAKFYMLHEVWKNGRLGMISNTINLQGDKFHRHMYGYDAWNITIDPVKHPNLLVQAKLAIAESLGIKVDKMDIPGTLAEFDALIATDVMVKGLAAVNRIQSDRNVDSRSIENTQDDLYAAIKAGGEKAFSLDGLVNLAKLQTNKPFEFNLFREVDGITNGVIIGTWQLGAFDKDANDIEERMSKGGIYFTESGKSYGERAMNKNNLDSYQDLSLLWNKIMDVFRNPPQVEESLEPEGPSIGLEQAQAAVETLRQAMSVARTDLTNSGQNGSDAHREVSNRIRDIQAQAKLARLAVHKARSAQENKGKRFVKRIDPAKLAALDNLKFGRNVKAMFDRAMSKNPLMITNYGAAIKGVIAAFAEDTVSGIYQRIADTNGNADALTDIVNDINTITGMTFDIPVGEHLSTLMSKDMDAAIRKQVTDTYGVALEQALDEKYGAFKENRTTVNTAMSVMFEAFNIRFKRELAAKEASLGRILSSKEREDTVKGIYESVPAFNNYFSKLSGNRDEMTLAMKKKKVRQTDDDRYKQIQRYTKPLNGTKNPNTGDPVKQTKDFSSIDEWQDAGVAPMILGIHGIDAATMVLMLDAVAGLNVHDAYAFSLEDVISGTKTFNKGFQTVMSEYTIAEEVLKEVTHAIEVLMDEDANSGTDNITQLNAYLAEKELIDVEHYQIKANEELTNIINDKNAITEKVKRVSQYHTETGEYVKSIEERNQLADEFVFEDGEAYDDTVEILANVDELVSLVAKSQEEITISKPRKTKKSKAKISYKPRSRKVGKNVNPKPASQLGSSEINIDTNNFNEIYSDDINAEKSEQIFDDLSAVGNVTASPTHQANMRELLTGMVNKVLRPLTLKVKSEGNVTYGALVGDNVYLVNGVSALSNGIQMSSQEVYLHELIHSVTAAGIDGTSWAARELKQLFKVARANIKPTDFLNADMVVGHPDYATELAAATERYNYIFRNTKLTRSTKIDPQTGMESETVTNNYLHEFVALGLSNENFMRALSKLDSNPKYQRDKDTPYTKQLLAIFNKIMSFLTERITQTSHMQADEKLRALAEQLAGIDQRKKSVVYSMYDRTSELTGDVVNKAVQSVTKPLVKLAGSDIVQGSRFVAVRAAGKIGQALPTATFEQWQDIMERVRKNMTGMRTGFFAQLSTEARGRTKVNGYMHTLGRVSNKIIDQTRLEIQTRVAAHLLTTFSGPLSSDEKFAITRGMLKTDVSSITEEYDLNAIANFMTDKLALAKEIANVEKKLSAFGANQDYYTKQARNLGLIMATGNSLEHLTLRNAKNIADLIQTESALVGNAADAEAIIDVLATLHAIHYTDSKSKRLAAGVIKREMKSDPDHNGIVFTMQEHMDFKDTSAVTNFDGNERLIVKGYTKEINDPSVKFATVDETEVAEMLKQNWRIIEKDIKKDPSDPNKTKLVFMVNRDGLTARYDSGVVSLTSEAANGTNLISIRAKGGSIDPVVDANNDANIIWQRKQRAIANMFNPADTRIKSGATMLMQIHDGEGNVTGYRYTMSEANKRKILNKNDSFDDVLGGMVAGIQDKVNSADLNSQVVDALFEDYNTNYSKDPGAFVLISSKSTDKGLADIYNMMPAKMRTNVKETWGTKEMWVRSDMVTLVFGQRKASISNLTKSENEHAQGVEAIKQQFNNALVQLFNNPTARSIEAVWMEIIGAVKDAIVIKSGVVTMGNIGSNIILLKVLGVPMKDIVKNHGVAFNGAIAYQKDSKELFELERELERDHKVTDRLKMETRIAELHNNIATNPVKDMIDAGIYQSIVEDIGEVHSQYSYATKLEGMAKPITDRTPKLVKDAASQLFLTHETKAYKFLRDAAQLSDFVARYTLHEHNTKVNGMSKAESTNMIIETFINYDLPTHKAIQYMNDIGLIMFTKFFVRTQKVIFHILKEHPANVLATVALQGVVGDLSDIVDSNALSGGLVSKLNPNPLSLLPTLVDIPTLNLLEVGQ